MSLGFQLNPKLVNASYIWRVASYVDHVTPRTLLKKRKKINKCELTAQHPELSEGPRKCEHLLFFILSSFPTIVEVTF